MNEDAYRAWMISRDYAAGSIPTKLSDARRVEQDFGDLDAAFDKDGCAALLEVLAYSARDAESGKVPPIPIQGDAVRGMSGYRSAVRGYCRFRESAEDAAGVPRELTREAVLAAIARCDAAGSPEAYLNGLPGFDEPRKFWLLHEGRRYPSKAIVNDALMHVGITKKHDATICKAWLDGLGFVVIDWTEYRKARERFLRHMRPFTDFRAQQGTYWDEERRYKDQLLVRVKELAQADDSDLAIGEAVYRALAVGASGGGLPLSWRTLTTVNHADTSLRDRFFEVVGRLARSQATAEEALEQAAAELEALRDEGLAVLRRGEVLGIVISVWGSLHLDEASWFKVSRIEQMGKALFGRNLFAHNDFRLADFDEFAHLMRSLEALFEKEEGWEPADLFDVQGFIWVAFGNGQPGKAETAWFVSATWEGRDGVGDFLDQGEWRLDASYAADMQELVRQMQPGERIVLRDYLPNQRRAPVETNGGIFTAMDIRATGTITDQPGTGQSVGVEWDGAEQPPRRWFFYTHTRPVWQPPVDNPFTGQLMAFVFGRAEQDFDLFLADPTWNHLRGGAPQEEHVMPEPTNLILYGPPGTGKTYRTALEAVRLCDGGADYPDTPEGRRELMERYAALSKAGRIRFVTFHQSFAYEEFVEGLRPDTSGDQLTEQGDDSGLNGGFRLVAKGGVFKELANVADQARKRPGTANAGYDLSGCKFWKMGLGAIGSEDAVYEGALSGNYVVLGWGGDVDWSDERFSSQDEIRKEWQSMPRPSASPSNWTQLHPFRNTMKVGDIVIVPYGNTAFRAIGEVTGEYRFEPTGEGTYNHRRSVKWLFVPDTPLPLDTIVTGNFQMRTFYSIAESRVKKEALLEQINSLGETQQTPEQGGPAEVRQYVLIIDEINRANISKVFGELITLIEPDKRLGGENALMVTLPYSGEEFGVPANLHIIGTMNTADRSIALLDTALRRRFRFREMAPDVAVPAFQKAEADTGLPLAKVLTTINQRIEYLIDRDHRIGHAFFIGCSTLQHVDTVMRDKVIPLLQEYFFEDWGRIAAVLGAGFIASETLPVPPGLENGEPRKSWRVRDDAAGRPFPAAAYSTLIGQAGSATQGQTGEGAPDEA